jgi:hypothetical protein
MLVVKLLVKLLLRQIYALLDPREHRQRPFEGRPQPSECLRGLSAYRR